MDRLLAALERQNKLDDEPGLDVIVACLTGQEAAAAGRARQLRAQGLTVEVDLLGRNGDELQAYARTRGAGRIVSSDGATSEETACVRNRPATFNPIH